MPKQRFQIVPSVYVMLMKDGQIILARRYNTGYCDGEYSFPAGHLEGNETSTAALLREVKEEIGVELDPENIEFVHLMHRKGPDDERYDVFFACEKWEGEPKIMEPNKCDELAWFDLDKLPQNTIPYIAQATNSYRAKIFYSEHGWN